MIVEDQGSPLFDPFSDAAHRDPYPAYAAMRATGTAYYEPNLDFWFVARHQDVSAVVNDWMTFSSEYGEDIDDTATLFSSEGNLLEIDPPRHRELRRVIQGNWNPKSIKLELTSVVEHELDTLVNSTVLRRGERFDFGEAIAWALPVAVISAFMGVPAGTRAELLALQFEFVLREDGVAALPERAMLAARRLHDFFAEQLQWKRDHPASDLLGLIAQAEQRRSLGAEEAVGLAHMLFSAAIDTTACLLSNAILLLASHPSQQRLLRDDPTLITIAIEEILRYESPVQNAKRTTLRDATLSGAAIPQGATVVPLFGAANRDEQTFERAQVFDVRREPRRHLAFGAGVHHCIGAPLARLEAAVVLERFVTGLPPFELAGEPTRFASHAMRGASSVPIAFESLG